MTTRLAPTERGEHSEQPIAGDVSVPLRLLDRDDLLQRLDRAVSSKQLTVISAPPGSGKTSLLRAWADRSRKKRRVAFVSVDRDERDTQQFWSAVLDAVRGAAPAQTQPASTAALDSDQLTETVLSEFADEAKTVALVIDDLHELRSTEAMTQLEHLLANLPSSTHVVLSSRRDPSLRLHKLRLADEIADIRRADLCFSEAETIELLATSGVSLSDAGTAALYERTEGWAAGLRLAVISLRAHPDPERFVAEFSGTDRAIGEYLMAEMLEVQPSEVQGMLLRTSIVDRLNAELADLLTGRPGSEQLLLTLEDANAFVVSLNPDRTWFRYHQLLADFLGLELRRRFADEVPELHRRAAQWFDDHGYVIEAVRHTLAAGEWPDAARLLADHLFSLTLDGQEGAIAGLLRLFPEGASADHPDLALAHAATRLAQGRLDEAAAQLALAESHLQSSDPARRRRLTVAIASLRLARARRSGHFTEVIEQVDLLDASIADESNDRIAMDDQLRGVALMNLGIVEMWSGRLLDAERHLSEGAALAQAIGRPYLEVACRAHRGFPSKAVSVGTARERGLQAVALAERHGLDDQPVLAPALGAVAGMALWAGEFDEAESWLSRAWEVAEPRADPAAAVLLHVATGMLHAAGDEQRAALDEFAAAFEVQARLTGVHALAPRITSWLAATQARLGMIEEARATLAEFSGPPEQMGAIHNARAVVYMAEGNPVAALDELREAVDVTPRVGPPFTLIETHLLTGIAHLSLGDRNAAAAAAEAALAAAEPDRLIFSFAMTQARDLLDVLPRHETAHGALLADAVDLLQDGPASSTGEQPLPEVEQLSPSELRVLRFLPTNLTRAEIAAELYVSVNTVNTHVRSVYSKLGVGDRSSAVQRSRELRLLSTGLSRSSPN
jgi:LuxR family maltose regulon positive regulatory protein